MNILIALFYNKLYYEDIFFIGLYQLFLQSDKYYFSNVTDKCH